ncbi:hypothetical protein [Nostoc sp. UHCC 0870]|uniref:hypothetical protein n=1 Tax=Nostoc sp. UHCC 0870 TaxID=2914041 RepID=UPI001EDE4D36|nr:hypothetical protein [Nostoc sp. UHCC 0870]UKP01429.1 hypothetical protein L6494_29830 [Nostoc sp. UHCC 0870]
MTEKGLPYSAATESNGFPFGDYLLVSGFLDQAKPELSKAGVYLGLQKSENNQPAVESTTSRKTQSSTQSSQTKVTASTSRRVQKKASE